MGDVDEDHLGEDELRGVSGCCLHAGLEKMESGEERW